MDPMARHLCSLNQIQNSIVNNYHHAKFLRVELVVVVVVVVWYWAKPAAVENKTKSVLSHTYSCVLMFTLHKKLRYQCFLAEQQVGYNCSEVQFFFSTMHIYLWENAVYTIWLYVWSLLCSTSYSSKHRIHMRYCREFTLTNRTTKPKFCVQFLL